MNDLDRAMAAAREALAGGYASVQYDALQDLLAALDAARGEAVAGSVQSGSVTIPFWVIDYAQKIELFMRVNGVDEWAIGGIQSRDLPPPKAPPALQAELDHARRRIGELTIQLGEAMKAPPAALAVPADGAYFAGLDHTGRPIYRQVEKPQQPAAAVQEGMVMVQRADLEALAMTDFGRSFWCDGAELAARRIRAMLAAANEENTND